MKTNDKRTTIPDSNFGGGGPSHGGASKGSITPSYQNESMAFPQDGSIRGMESLQPNVNLDDPGFTADGRHMFKHGTPYGESAMFNQLPPGMDISSQQYALINEMPLKRITAMGYEGDGGFPTTDVVEK